jgi:hypothetical protein
MEHKMQKSEKPQGQFIPGPPGCSVAIARSDWFGVRVDWIELEPVVAWVRWDDGDVAPITKHGFCRVGGHAAVLSPTGKVVEMGGGSHESLAEWQRTLASL